MENLTGGTPPVRYLLCVVPCKLYFTSVPISLLFPVCGIPVVMAGVAGAVIICFRCNIVFMASCSLYSKSHLCADIWKSWSSSSISFNLFNKSELSADFIFIRSLSFLAVMRFCELCHHPVCAIDLWGYDKECSIERNKKADASASALVLAI